MQGSAGLSDILLLFFVPFVTVSRTSLSTSTPVGLGFPTVLHSLQQQRRTVLWFTRRFVLGHALEAANNKVERWLWLLTKMFNTLVGIIVSMMNKMTELMLIGMALVWLFSPQVPLALLPFAVYSVFHVATYTRSNLLPAIQTPQAPAAQGASPGGRPATKSSPLADTIGRFVKQYYDASMTLVAGLEILLWFRILLSAITFAKGSWILFVIYTAFFRARFSQSSFVQAAISNATTRGDALVANQSTPPVARQAWQTLKGLTRQAADATDINRYVGGQKPGVKKAQ